MEKLQNSGWIKSDLFDNYFIQAKNLRYYGGGVTVVLAKSKQDNSFYVVLHKDDVYFLNPYDRYRKINDAFGNSLLNSDKKVKRRKENEELHCFIVPSR